APRGGCNPSLQPLRATVPYQLQRGSALLCREVSTVDRTAARPPKPAIRRTLSLDTVVGPYLQGQWPRDAEGTAGSCVRDKATQQTDTATQTGPGRRSKVNVKKALLRSRCAGGGGAAPEPPPMIDFNTRCSRRPDSEFLGEGDSRAEKQRRPQALGIVGKRGAPEGGESPCSPSPGSHPGVSDPDPAQASLFCPPRWPNSGTSCRSAPATPRPLQDTSSPNPRSQRVTPRASLRSSPSSSPADGPPAAPEQTGSTSAPQRGGTEPGAGGGVCVREVGRSARGWASLFQLLQLSSHSWISDQLLGCPGFGHPRWPPGPRARAEMQQRLPERALPRAPGSFPVSVPVPLPFGSIAPVAPGFSLSHRTVLFHSLTVSLSRGGTRRMPVAPGAMAVPALLVLSSAQQNLLLPAGASGRLRASTSVRGSDVSLLQKRPSHTGGSTL
ncbi:unnamed protein product, partial [Tetraodon nigroviridis]